MASWNINVPDGDLKADGTIPMIAEWDFGDKGLVNVKELGVGTNNPLDILHVSSAVAANALRVSDSLGTVAINGAPVANVELSVFGEMAISTASGRTSGYSITGGTGNAALKAFNISVDTGSGDLRSLLQQNSAGIGSAEYIARLLAGSGDAVYKAEINGGQVWTWGLDNTDDSFRLAEGGTLGIGDRLSVVDGGLFTLFQPASGGAVPVLTLDQSDIDDSFVNFKGTSAADSTRSISSSTAEVAAKVGAVLCEFNGATFWLRGYASAV